MRSGPGWAYGTVVHAELLRRWRSGLSAYLDDRLRLLLRNGVAGTASFGGFTAVQAGAVLAVVLFRHRVDPGAAALIMTALFGLTSTLVQIGFSGRTFIRQAGYAQDLRGLIEGLPEERGVPDTAPAATAPPDPLAGQGVGPATFPHPLGVGIRLESVGYRYPGASADALRDVSADIRKGEVVALVGANGAGKSTLAALILGLYRPASGTLRVRGGPRPASSAVVQDFARYTLPVRDNVGFGDLARREDDASLRAALRRAGSDLEDGLDTWLGHEFGGADLSGGQWLRLALARGTLPDAGLVVLDEPTAAIDPLAEVDIVRRLLEVGRGRTAVVVSHRLGIARAADRILVLDGGRIAEEGTHAELLARQGLYARMWSAQASWYAPPSPGASAPA